MSVRLYVVCNSSLSFDARKHIFRFLERGIGVHQNAFFYLVLGMSYYFFALFSRLESIFLDAGFVLHFRVMCIGWLSIPYLLKCLQKLGIF